jgi:phosphate transport system substrate-binding protein
MFVSGKLKINIIIVLLLVGLIMTGCKSSDKDDKSDNNSSNTQPQVTLTASGSGNVSTILAAIESGFEADTPGFNLNILPGTNTGGGVAGVLNGSLEVAAMARAPNEEETAQGLQYVRFGGSGVAIMVHRDLSITDLSQDQVKAIFTGEIANWAEVGGDDQPIVVYVRDDNESATVLLRQVIFGDAPFSETVAGTLTSSGDMLAAVEGTPNSIGFGIWTGNAAAERVKPLTLDGIAVNDPAYPIISPLGIGYVENRHEVVQPLVDWLLSERGQTALQEIGVIGVE